MIIITAIAAQTPETASTTIQLETKKNCDTKNGEKREEKTKQTKVYLLSELNTLVLYSKVGRWDL